MKKPNPAAQALGKLRMAKMSPTARKAHQRAAALRMWEERRKKSQ